MTNHREIQEREHNETLLVGSFVLTNDAEDPVGSDGENFNQPIVRHVGNNRPPGDTTLHSKATGRNHSPRGGGFQPPFCGRMPQLLG